MSAEPLTREERERIALHYERGYEDGHGIRLDVERLLATIQAAGDRAERLRAGVERLRLAYRGVISAVTPGDPGWCATDDDEYAARFSAWHAASRDLIAALAADDDARGGQ